jgi:hypothetical protein
MVGAGSAMVGCGVRLIGSARASAGDILGVIIDLVCCASVYAQLFLDLRTAANLKMTWAEKAETFPLSQWRRDCERPGPGSS